MSVINESPQITAGEGRLQQLARLAGALSDALSVRDATAAVATSGARALDADSVSVCLLRDDGTAYDLAASDGLRPDMVEEWRTFAADAPVPAVDAVRDRALVVIDGVADRERRYPVFGDGPISSHTIVCAPMLVSGTTAVGALVIGFAQPRQLDEADRTFIQAAADLCGQAVHRARLFDYQRRAATRQRFLAHAASLLVAELDHDRTLDQIARLAVAELADVCAVCLIDDDDTLRPVTAVHRDPAGQEIVDGLVARRPAITDEATLEVARSGEAVLVPRLDIEQREAGALDEAHLALIRGLDASSAIMVPMQARGRVVGLLLMLLTSGSTLDEADLRMAEKLAAWAALALDNSRLYAEQAELVEHLQIALGSHRAIEQAKGMLAGRLGISPTQAFDRMRRHARSARRKIEDIAEDVVAGRDDLGA